MNMIIFKDIQAGMHQIMLLLLKMKMRMKRKQDETTSNRGDSYVDTEASNKFQFLRLEPRVCSTSQIFLQMISDDIIKK